MDKKKILIVGGGFAGLAALNKLTCCHNLLEVEMIDKNSYSNFLPLLPDIIGRRIKPESLNFEIKSFAERLGFKFINEEVTVVDILGKRLTTKSHTYPYDYLLIASGSETNFYGKEEIKKNAYKIDDTQDMKNILNKLRQDNYENYLISGGGYTGIEVATNLWKYFKDNKINKKIIIVEFAPQLLGMLTEKIRDYVYANLKKLKIEILLNSTVEKIENDTVYVSGGKVFTNAALIWTAGVKAADFVSNLPLEKNRQGRLKLNEYLKITDSCFVAGDAGEFIYNGKPLRMGVQFSLTQGVMAAENILRSIRGLPLKKYLPRDPGYIIPMANNCSCGLIMGIYISGSLATYLHYFMCIYRTRYLKNKIGIAKDLLL